MPVLLAAWHAIRRNAETSQQKTTKLNARKFGENLPSNLSKLQRRLRDGYHFDKAYGATPPKGGGKPGKRPIVVAPLEDRIVQRAILDVLQDATEISAVQSVLKTPTSVGGIRGRGVDHAIKLFDERVKAGDRYVAGSDISGFFTKISRPDVIDFLTRGSVEPEFVQLVDCALTVELSNADKLSEDDRKLFPTGKDGVAQGCPLSALAGNIVLERFDRQMNARGITCIRYIDDFIVMGKSRSAVGKALEGAKRHLSELGMDIYDPCKSPTKAFIGTVDDGWVFLGYKLLPGIYPPADAANLRLVKQVNDLISVGKHSIAKAAKDRKLTGQDRCYAQTLVAIDHVVRGWRRSFRISKCPDVFERLDREIDRRLADFRDFYSQTTAKCSAPQKRRALGVHLLSD
ncbi:reverse transcriptase domain-containing protein [Faunimonas sp. B44]|uniref:reverse transcriptase domain-containing protein n=1 Tax=Faunimonas sp. B44 TaxID=3461493 RepID=UPI004043D84D